MLSTETIKYLLNLYLHLKYSAGKVVHVTHITKQISPKNKDLCKTRSLGIGDSIPDIIDQFDNVKYIQDTKNIGMFDYSSTYHSDSRGHEGENL